MFPDSMRRISIAAAASATMSHIETAAAVATDAKTDTDAYGDDGKEAIRKLLTLGHERGIIPHEPRIDFAP